LEVSQIAKSGC